MYCYGKLLRFFQIWVDVQILLTKDEIPMSSISYSDSMWSNKCRLVPRCPKLAYIIKTIPLVNKLPQATMQWLNNGHYRSPSPKLFLPTTLTTMNVFEERESFSFSSSYFCDNVHLESAVENNLSSNGLPFGNNFLGYTLSWWNWNLEKFLHSGKQSYCERNLT